MLHKLSHGGKDYTIDLMGDIEDKIIKCSLSQRTERTTVYYNDPRVPKKEGLFNGEKTFDTFEEAINFVDEMGILKICKRVQFYHFSFLI